MKNRVEYQEDVKASIERIPFLKRFLWGDDGIPPHVGACPYFDPSKINEYMGFHWTKKRSLTSKNMNEILEEAERRGDL
jgi:hypothetical protein